MSLFESLASLAGTISYNIKKTLGIKMGPLPFPIENFVDPVAAANIQRKGIWSPLAEINNTKADFSKKDQEIVQEYISLNKKLDNLNNQYNSTGNPAKKDLLLAEIKQTEAILDGNIEEQHKNIETLNIRLVEARNKKEITSDDEWNSLLKESAEKYYINYFIPLPKRKQAEPQG